MDSTPSDATDPGLGPVAVGWEQTQQLIAACRVAISGLREHVALATGTELQDCLAALGELSLATDAAEVAVVSAAVEQGQHLAGPAPQPPAGWVQLTSRRYAAGPGAARLVTLAKAVAAATTTRKAGILAPASEVAELGAAILDGRAPITAGALALAEMKRLAPDLRDGVKPMVWAGYARIAAEGDLRDVRRLRQWVYANYGDPDRQAKDAETAKAHVALTGASVAGDGLHEYRLTLDDEGAAILEAALDSLTKPETRDGQPDPRSWVTRRADALIDLVRRAVTAGGGVPAQPATQLSLTMRLSDLLAGDGAATTITGLDAGRFLTAAIVDRLSCGAAVAPIVLDDHGNIVLVGRGKRLFTRDQIRALHARDHHCTFPGCRRPAGWTDAHHLIHWLHGGETELDNAALLCSFHHHIVHSRRLAGRVTTGPPGSPDEHRQRVVWDLRPGSYDDLLAGRRHGIA